MLQVLHWPRTSACSKCCTGYVSKFELLSDTIEALYALNAMNALSATNDQKGRRTRAGALTNYNKIIYVFPEYANKNWRELIYFAYKNDKKTNFGYFARRNWNIQEDYIRKIKNQFNNMDLDSNSVYYFSDKKIYEELSKKVASISTKVIVQDSNGLNHMLIIPNK